MKPRKQFFMECHVAGKLYHDADDVWSDLKVGTKLQLVREADNRYDADAVQIVFEKDSEEYLLGYIPRQNNSLIAKLLDMGWNNIFECHINRLTPDVHPEQQIRVTLRIRRNEAADAGNQ